MTNKQITLLGLVAAMAFSFALVSNHQPSPTEEIQPLTVPPSVVAASSSAYSYELAHSQPRGSPATLTASSTGVQQTIVPHESRQNSVYVQIIDPDGTGSFEVKLNPGDDLCANLVEAKAEGKIRSLTIDDSYLAVFHSRYIREINGFSNNWTVEVNGIKPKGCSLYKPKVYDHIKWAFGV